CTMFAHWVSHAYRIRPNDIRGVLEMSPSGGVANDWQPLAMGFVDLQVAMRMKKTITTVDHDGDGDMARDWYSGANITNILANPPAADGAVTLLELKITLVARTTAEVPGPATAQIPAISLS